jgi:glutamate carboxypeptidase
MPSRRYVILPLAITASLLLPAQSSLTPSQAAMMRAVDAQKVKAQTLLERLVNQNSGTFNTEGVKVVAAYMVAELVELGFNVELLSMESIHRGPHILAVKKGSRPARPVLLIGHMDTVFEPSSPFQRFELKPDGRTALGPGTADMKGGLVVMMTALRALRASDDWSNLNITVFLTADEEAPGELAISRKDLIEQGRKAKAALCFETGVRGVTEDAVSTARRGFTGWELRSYGKAGHSGQMFTDKFGYGAIFEMSRILDEFQKTLREPNMTFNVGLMLGGADPKADRSGQSTVSGKDNIIPGEALARGEIRALSPEQVARVKDRMQGIVAKSLPGTRSQITFEEGYPPMAPTPGNRRLLRLLNEGNLAAGLPDVGELDPMQRGAGDISFIAPYVDSLSGLGLIGTGSHAVGEYADLASIPRQAKRAALLIYRLAHE